MKVFSTKLASDHLSNVYFTLVWKLMTMSDVRNISKLQSKKISNDQELIQSDPISCPQNQKGNN